MSPFRNSAVAVVFDGYSKSLRSRLLALRELIFTVAARTPGVGEIEEALKWGQPSYLTTETKSGSTIRLGAIPADPGKYALYCHCQTTLIETFKERYGTIFCYEDNRALVFSQSDRLPIKAVSGCIELALTYHLQKRPHRLPIGSFIRSRSRRP